MRSRLGRRLTRAALAGGYPLYQKLLAPVVRQAFFTDLIGRTDNFRYSRWLGTPLMQNPLDLWTMQETISEVRPELVIECGTFKGGSALFFAHMFDLLGEGRVLTIDIEDHVEVRHERVTYLVGSTLDKAVLDQVRTAAQGVAGPVMVILDDDHREEHVAKELEAYAPFVTKGSYMLVQDGFIDTMVATRMGIPGPLGAIRRFVAHHPEFEVDEDRCSRFLVTHHPMGWLRRRESS